MTLKGLKRCVFNLFLNKSIDRAVCIEAGCLFHTLGAHTANARSPSPVLEFGTIRWPRSLDPRMVNWYDEVLQVLWSLIMEILMNQEMGLDDNTGFDCNQCNCLKIGLMLSYFLAPVTKRAAQFWTFSNVLS